MSAAKTKSTVLRELSGSIAIVETLDSGAITLVPSNVSLEERVAMRIYQIEYYGGFYTGASPSADSSLFTAMAASLDSVKFGFSFLAVQPVGGFLEYSPGVVDFNRVTRKDFGTAASGQLLIDPFIVKNMRDRHPDGMLVHPANLYYWKYTNVALGAACFIPFKIYYSMEDITDAEWEMLWKTIFVTQAG